MTDSSIHEPVDWEAQSKICIILFLETGLKTAGRSDEKETSNGGTNRNVLTWLDRAGLSRTDSHSSPDRNVACFDDTGNAQPNLKTTGGDRGDRINR